MKQCWQLKTGLMNGNSSLSHSLPPDHPLYMSDTQIIAG